MVHSGSFVGRDFKILGQILPVILRKNFIVQKGGILDLVIQCLDTYGLLCSLTYMRAIDMNLNSFASMAHELVLEITERVLILDNKCIELMEFVEPPLISLQPKLRLLHHLRHDIIRFGQPVHCETEHGEQFNKFIREEILLTNQLYSERDVDLKFAKQFVVRHLLNGGPYLVKEKDSFTGLF